MPEFIFILQLNLPDAFILFMTNIKCFLKKEKEEKKTTYVTCFIDKDVQ